MTADTAAARLEGLILNEHWKVLRIINQRTGGSGGRFSVGYEIENIETGAPGYLKAIDFEKVFRKTKRDLIDIIVYLSTAFKYERDLLYLCRNKRMSKVIVALEDGQFDDGGDIPVPYLILERADRDSRAQLDLIEKLDFAWRFRSLQHVSTGIQQLHGTAIVHQDVKPSNIMVFDSDRGDMRGHNSKIGDMGTAIEFGNPAPYENDPVPGDRTYVAPEFLYGHHLPDEKDRRFALDMYLIGNLAYFFFTQSSIAARTISLLDPALRPRKYNGSFHDVLPSLLQSWSEAIMELDKYFRPHYPELADRFIAAIQELTNPNPEKRGHPKNILHRSANQYSLERYISTFNFLADRAGPTHD